MICGGGFRYRRVDAFIANGLCARSIATDEEKREGTKSTKRREEFIPTEIADAAALGITAVPDLLGCGGGLGRCV